jgi:hypothetical protein
MGGLLPEVNMKLTKKQLSASYVTQATASVVRHIDDARAEKQEPPWVILPGLIAGMPAMAGCALPAWYNVCRGRN